ncbi:inner-membrane translocator [Salinarchaeum sp. Harcht-Bsk1]|uniref:branched-chain amino acid ABC transporter permease n=1 Tax=Salinarchaeum sp. Harcht-Bsk1 TaxID=1333523 RepID=UPI0003424619|nr:branched-chain amino acid ABC transporter permease [Salinarchaeum sp. Harcht-Bsk1]AGN00168.1 inner-membrane translocator [Salinarchaeum sp. Harcht-Bsk1]
MSSDSAFVRATDAVMAQLRTRLRPVWDAICTVLAPLDRALQPVAGLYNRSLGRHFGTMTGLQFAVITLGFAMIATVPFWSPLYSETLNITFAVASIWAIFAMSWDIQSGYTGYISFGHSVLSGAAGYTIGLLILHYDPSMGPLTTIPIAVLASLVLGLVIAVPSLRLRGPYFSLITLVGVLLFTNLIFAFSEWTNGELGIHQVDPFTYEPWVRYYYMAIPMLAIAVGLTYVARSNVGMVLLTIRENERAVSSAGLDPTKFKISSFVLSSIPMGIGGALLVYYGRAINPVSFVEISNSIEIIALAVIGGMGSIIGPLFGSFLFFFLEEEFLRDFIDDSSTRTLVLWLFVLGVLVFARNGVFRVVWHGLGAVRGDSE